MALVEGHGGGSGGSTTTSLQQQAEQLLGYELVQPVGTSDEIWNTILTAVVSSGDVKEGTELLASIYQDPPQSQGPYGNLTGADFGLGGPGVSVNLGGGGISGPSAAERRRMLEGQLIQSGFGALPFSVDGLIRETVAAKGSFSSLVQRLVNDNRFKRAFPGILDEDGNLRMAPRDWQNQFSSFQELAAQANVGLNRKRFGRLLDGEVSEREFSTRISAAASMKANRGVFNEFNRLAKRMGVGSLDKPKDVFNFLTGKAPKPFYALYEQASVSAAARAAGTDVSDKRLMRIARRTQGITTFEGALGAFEQAASDIRLASVELRRAGLSEKDIQNLQLGIGGGKTRGGESVAAVRERVLAQRKLALETQGAQAQVGLEGSRPVLTGAEENL